MIENKDGVEEIKKELDLEDLDQVSGGALGNVIFAPTQDISEDTKKKI